MHYEWDTAKARRSYLMKFAAVWLASIAVAGIPVMIALKAGALAGSSAQASAASIIR